MLCADIDSCGCLFASAAAAPTATAAVAAIAASIAASIAIASIAIASIAIVAHALPASRPTNAMAFAASLSGIGHSVRFVGLRRMAGFRR